MKPLYSDATVQFRVMKEQPVQFNPDGSPCVIDKYGKVVTLSRPFLPGEKCYLREAWCEDYSGQTIHYKSDGGESPGPKGFWRSPVTMPQWAARRFFEVVSCTPMRIGEVTEEDARKAGIQFIEHDKWNGQDFWGIKGDYDTYAPNAYGSFLFIWEKKHPGTWPDCWVWRREIREA